MEALALHPSHPDARDNLRDARKYMRDNGMPSREGQLLSSTQAQAIALGEVESQRDGGLDEGTEDDDFGSELSDEGGAGEHAARATPKDTHRGSAATAAHSSVSSSAASAFSSPVDLPYDAFLASRGIRHRVRRLPRIHASELWQPQHVEFARGQRPYVLLGAVRNASALAAVGRPDFFTRSGPFVERTADFYPANMDDKEVRPYLVPLAEAVRELLAPSDRFPRPSAAHPGRYVHFNMRWGDWQALMRLLGPLALPPNMANTDAWLGAAFDSDAERDEFQVRACVRCGGRGECRSSVRPQRCLGVRVYGLCCLLVCRPDRLARWLCTLLHPFTPPPFILASHSTLPSDHEPLAHAAAGDGRGGHVQPRGHAQHRQLPDAARRHQDVAPVPPQPGGLPAPRPRHVPPGLRPLPAGAAGGLLPGHGEPLPFACFGRLLMSSRGRERDSERASGAQRCCSSGWLLLSSSVLVRACSFILRLCRLTRGKRCSTRRHTGTRR